MLEAVGEAYWSDVFRQLRDSLRPGGIAVLQVITIDEARFKTYRRQPDFIQKYIFPGGMLPTRRSWSRRSRERACTLSTTERFGKSYVNDPSNWQRRFQQAWPGIERLGFDIPDSRGRGSTIWLIVQAGFEAKAVNVGLYKIMRPTN